MKIRAGVVATVIAVGAALLPAALPASAAPTANASACATHYVCVWTNGGFTGQMWSGSGYASYLDVPSYEHDRGSSWANHNITQRECIFDHVNGRQVVLDYLPAGTNRPVVPDGTNDRIDAIGWC